MKRLRLSGSARPDTCSALTVVPRMTNRSTPASTTVRQNCWVRCGVSAPATVTPASRISLTRAAIRSGLIGLGVDLLHARASPSPASSRGDLGEQGLGVLVPRPQALEVEHAEAAEPARARRPWPGT